MAHEIRVTLDEVAWRKDLRLALLGARKIEQTPNEPPAVFDRLVNLFERADNRRSQLLAAHHLLGALHDGENIVDVVHDVADKAAEQSQLLGMARAALRLCQPARFRLELFSDGHRQPLTLLHFPLEFRLPLLDRGDVVGKRQNVHDFSAIVPNRRDGYAPPANRSSGGRVLRDELGRNAQACVVNGLSGASAVRGWPPLCPSGAAKSRKNHRSPSLCGHERSWLRPGQSGQGVERRRATRAASGGRGPSSPRRPESRRRHPCCRSP